MERTETEIAAQAELLKIADELESIQGRLWTVHASLPEPPRQEADQDDEELDVATEVRAVIECVQNDWLRSAVRDLREGAKYRQEGAK
jgi:hypothetical protein